MNKCIDCKFYDYSKICFNQKNEEYDYIEGVLKYPYYSCQDCRLNSNLCGKKGKWWEKWTDQN